MAELGGAKPGQQGQGGDAPEQHRRLLASGTFPPLSSVPVPARPVGLHELACSDMRPQLMRSNLKTPDARGCAGRALLRSCCARSA